MATGCPLQSALPTSLGEALRPGEPLPEIRAYKLGKKRWSYNSVELDLGEAPGGSGRTAAVAQVVHADSPRFAAAHQDSAVAFHVHLESGARLQAHVYLCFEGARPSHADADAADGAGCSDSCQNYAWNLVTRQDCCKGCEGRVLRSIQRFGRLGKRAAGSSAPKAVAEPADGAPGSKKKDPRCMYLSLDEACTHVNASAFRLVAGIYNRQGTRLLTTAVSPPIRVLANNDVPTGAARISLQAHLPSDWEGWSAEGLAASPSTALTKHSRSERGSQPSSRRRLSLKSSSLASSAAGCRTPVARTLAVNINTPDASEAPRLLRTTTAPELSFAAVGSSEVWQGRSVQLSRQMSLPPLLPFPAAAPSGDDSESGGSCGAGLAPAVDAWGAPASLPLPPHLHPFAQRDPAVAQREADRQLFILQQLKCHMATTNQPASSCCAGGSVEQLLRADSTAASLQQQMLSSPAARVQGSPSLCAPSPPLQLQRLPAALAACDSLATADTYQPAPHECMGLTPRLGGLAPLGAGCDLEALELEELHSMMLGSHADKAAMLEMESLFDGGEDVMLML